MLVPRREHPAHFLISKGSRRLQSRKYRSGQVTEEGGRAYEEFLTRLKKLNLGEIARCQERQGLASLSKTR